MLGQTSPVIPGGMTSQLLLLDISINKPCRDRFREHYTNWLTSEEHQLTPNGRIRHASLGQLANWIATAWNKIPDETVITAFKKCCISNTMDGSEDDALWDPSASRRGGQ